MTKSEKTKKWIKLKTFNCRTLLSKRQNSAVNRFTFNEKVVHDNKLLSGFQYAIHDSKGIKFMYRLDSGFAIVKLDSIHGMERRNLNKRFPFRLKALLIFVLSLLIKTSN